ncbi:MAG: hypothetical protein P0S96_06915 [Simkaniaceae bacterium]|nr:hypothetical protein [Candidatus Sacchlamyda saccharinae]
MSAVSLSSVATIGPPHPPSDMPDLDRLMRVFARMKELQGGSDEFNLMMCGNADNACEYIGYLVELNALDKAGLVAGIALNRLSEGQNPEAKAYFEAVKIQAREANPAPVIGT